MLRGIFPITITPFDAQGAIDEASLRRVVRFELAGGVDGLGVGGFASEAYKMTDAERLRCAEIVADEAGPQTRLIIGMAAGSTAAAIQQARHYAALRPAALMVLPPHTMALDEAALIAHYVRLADAVDTPLMVQVSPQIMAYSGVRLTVDALCAIAEQAPNVRYFKIEGPGSAERIAAIHQRLGERATLFGGVGGIGLRQELQSGASGLLPGCGFNEHFVAIWRAWQTGDAAAVDDRLTQIQPLVEAVSARGHEFSLHARKRLFYQAGVIRHTTVRAPSVNIAAADLDAVAALAATMGLRLLRENRAEA